MSDTVSYSEGTHIMLLEAVFALLVIAFLASLPLIVLGYILYGPNR